MEGFDLLEKCPEILVRIQHDIDAVAKQKKRVRLEDAAWYRARCKTIPGMECTSDVPEDLFLCHGRPRKMDAGDGFVPLIPEGGYMSPCWADVPRGTIHQFELSPGQSAQTIRFRFVSDGGLANEGWKIQSIRIIGSAVIPGPHYPPSCGHTGVRLFMPADEFRPGDICRLDAHICSAEQDVLMDVPVFFLLEVDGQFWFWPSWSEMDYQTMNLFPGITGLTVVEPFVWPSGAGSYGPIYFYGALLNESMTAILGHWDSVSFSFWE